MSSVENSGCLRAPAESRAARSALRQQLGVARIRVDHPRAMRMEEVLEAEAAFLVRQLVGRLQAQLEVPIARLVRARTPRAARASTAPG